MEKHGMSFSRVYRIWIGMKGRCLNPKHTKFYMYGGKGVTICSEWLSFTNFFADMGEPPTRKHTLDRRNGKLGYCKDNCRWATAKEQSSNTCTNHMLTYKGETLTQAEWARRLNISDSSLSWRISKGWSIEQALESAPHTRIRKHKGGWPRKNKI